MKAIIVQTSRVSIVLATALLLSACGSSGVTGNPSTTTQPQGDMAPTAPVVDAGTGYAAYPLSFKTVGKDVNGGPSIPVISSALRTDSKLIVKATISPATHNENTPVYTNYTANYSCVTLHVTLLVEQNGSYIELASVDTNRLTAAGTSGCAGSVASQNIDFSAYMTPGHGNVKIRVTALTSNVNCLNYANGVGSWPYNYGQVCASNPMQSIYQYHVVNGNLEVQVNGTSFVN